MLPSTTNGGVGLRIQTNAKESCLECSLFTISITSIDIGLDITSRLLCPFLPTLAMGGKSIVQVRRATLTRIRSTQLK